MKIVLKVCLCFTLLVSIGCVSIQEPIAVEDGLYQDADRLLVVMEQIPQATTHFPGADCLLCLLTAEGLHMTLGEHVETLKAEEFKVIESQIAAKLRENGLDVVISDEPVTVRDLPRAPSSGENMSSRDFTNLAAEHEASHVLVISVNLIGISRAFASYIPTEEPVARVRGFGYLVDVRDGTFDWYQPFDVAQGVEGEWDQPPDFPKLTNAFYQVLAKAQDEILSHF